MKRLCLIPALAMAVLQASAQTDAPPELAQPPASTSLPKPDVPFRRPSKLQIEFEGNSAFKGWQLREGIARQIQSIEEFGLDDANVYDAVFFLESFYRRHGYSQAEVTSNVLGPWRLRLIVKEGPLTRVGAITFIGNQAYDTATLTNYLLGPIRERYPRIRHGHASPFHRVGHFLWSGTH